MLIHNSQKLKTIQIPFHGWVVKLTVVPSNKKEWIIDTCNNMDKSPENSNMWKKSIPEGYILYDSMYITPLNGKVSEMENKLRLLGLRSWGRREMIWVLKGNIRDPHGDGNVLSLDHINVSILIVILYYNFTKCYHWVKHRWDLSVLFLTTVCKSTML